MPRVPTYNGWVRPNNPSIRQDVRATAASFGAGDWEQVARLSGALHHAGRDLMGIAADRQREEEMERRRAEAEAKRAEAAASQAEYINGMMAEANNARVDTQGATTVAEWDDKFAGNVTALMNADGFYESARDMVANMGETLSPLAKALGLDGVRKTLADPAMRQLDKTLGVAAKYSGNYVRTLDLYTKGLEQIYGDQLAKMQFWGKNAADKRAAKEEQIRALIKDKSLAFGKTLMANVREQYAVAAKDELKNINEFLLKAAQGGDATEVDANLGRIAGLAEQAAMNAGGGKLRDRPEDFAAERDRIVGQAVATAAAAALANNNNGEALRIVKKHGKYLSPSARLQMENAAAENNANQILAPMAERAAAGEMADPKNSAEVSANMKEQFVSQAIGDRPDPSGALRRRYGAAWDEAKAKQTAELAKRQKISDQNAGMEGFDRFLQTGKRTSTGNAAADAITDKLIDDHLRKSPELDTKAAMFRESLPAMSDRQIREIAGNEDKLNALNILYGGGERGKNVVKAAVAEDAKRQARQGDPFYEALRQEVINDWGFIDDDLKDSEKDSRAQRFVSIVEDNVYQREQKEKRKLTPIEKREEADKVKLYFAQEGEFDGSGWVWDTDHTLHEAIEILEQGKKESSYPFAFDDRPVGVPENAVAEFVGTDPARGGNWTGFEWRVKDAAGRTVDRWNGQGEKLQR